MLNFQEDEVMAPKERIFEPNFMTDHFLNQAFIGGRGSPTSPISNVKEAGISELQNVYYSKNDEMLATN